MSLLAQPICINITGHHVLITSCQASEQNRLGIAPFCHECSEAANDYVWPCVRLSDGGFKRVASYANDTYELELVNAITAKSFDHEVEVIPDA